MDVKPLKGDPIKTAEKVQYIEFKWYVWKSHRKAIVRFSE